MAGYPYGGDRTGVPGGGYVPVSNGYFNTAVNGSNPGRGQGLNFSNQYNNAPVNTGTQSPYSSFTATTPAVSPDQENARKQQQDYIAALQAQMMGQGPNLAQAQLNEATQRNQSMTAGAVASQRGINPGLAAREALQMGSNIQQQAAGQSGTLRAEQMLGTQQLLGQTLGGVRGQDINAQQVIGGQNLQAQGLNQATAGQNLQANLQQQMINQKASDSDWDHYTKIVGSLANVGSMLAMAGGGTVPGKARVSGDSRKNDTVDAKLSPGEAVLPRSVMQAEDAPERAAEFVRAIRRKHYASGGEVHYGHVVKHQRETNARLERLEKMIGGKKK